MITCKIKPNTDYFFPDKKFFMKIILYEVGEFLESKETECWREIFFRGSEFLSLSCKIPNPEDTLSGLPSLYVCVYFRATFELLPEKFDSHDKESLFEEIEKMCPGKELDLICEDTTEVLRRDFHRRDVESYMMFG